MNLFDSQTINSATINKENLPSLIPSSNNSAESLLAGLLLRLIGELRGQIVDGDENEIVDPSGNRIIYDQSSINQKIDSLIWRTRIANGFIEWSIVIKFRFPPSTPANQAIDPDLLD